MEKGTQNKVYTLTERQLFDFGEHIAMETVKKMMGETLVSRAQAVDILNVSVQTMTAWEKKGILKAVSNAGNRYMYRLSDVNRLAGRL